MGNSEKPDTVDVSTPTEIEIIDFDSIIRSLDEASEELFEGFDEEVEAFMGESERAGKIQPIIFVDDGLYERATEVSDVGALSGRVPVRILPKEKDLYSMLNRYSFSEGVKDVLEGGQALLVNPGKPTNYEGIAHLEVGDEIAEKVYTSAVERFERDTEYLQNTRGIDVNSLPDAGLKIRVNEEALGRSFDYSEGDNLTFRFGDEEVELGYENVESTEVNDKYEFVVER